MRIFAAAKASLVFIKDRCRTSRWEMYFKIGVLKKFRNISKKIVVLESLFNKVAGLQVFSCEDSEVFNSSFSYRTPPLAASTDVLF